MKFIKSSGAGVFSVNATCSVLESFYPPPNFLSSRSHKAASCKLLSQSDNMGAVPASSSSSSSSCCRMLPSSLQPLCSDKEKKIKRGEKNSVSSDVSNRKLDSISLKASWVWLFSGGKLGWLRGTTRLPRVVVGCGSGSRPSHVPTRLFIRPRRLSNCRRVGAEGRHLDASLLVVRDHKPPDVNPEQLDTSA